MHLAPIDALFALPWIDMLVDRHPSVFILIVWGIAMLSYHQDARGHDPWWAVISQILAIACLVALIVFGVTRRSWANLVIAPPLIWLHVQFTKRWWARPGAWW